MMGKKTIATLLVGATLTTGVLLTFNSKALEDAKSGIDKLVTKITEYDKNDKELVEKYSELKKEAEAKLAELNSELETSNAQNVELTKQIETLKTTIEDLNNKLEELEGNKKEVERLTKELENANKLVAEHKNYVDQQVSKTETMKPTNPDNLPSLAEKSTATANFYNGYIHLDINLKENINLSLKSKDDIIIKYIDENGKVLKTKDKTWAGYLNDTKGDKYGKGINIPSNNYSNDVKAGVYSTTINSDNKIDVNNVASIEVIINKNGVSQSIIVKK